MPTLHCWADGPEEIVQDGGDEGQWWTRLRSEGSTCLLPAGHQGPHEYTPDREIQIIFRETENP